MAVGFYNNGKENLCNGTVDWDTGGTVTLLLIDNAGSYVFNPDDNVVADLTPGTNESTGTGYARKAVGTRTVTQNDTNDNADGHKESTHFVAGHHPRTASKEKFPIHATSPI